jgi:hypothetical protein
MQMPPFPQSTQWAAKRRLTPLPSQGWRGEYILGNDRCAERKDSVKMKHRGEVSSGKPPSEDGNAQPVTFS